MNKRRKYLVISSSIALILIGLSYVVAMGGAFQNQALMSTTLIEIVPEKCEVMAASPGVDASLEFKRDVFGNISDKTYVEMISHNVYEGAKVSFNIVVENKSNMPLSVDNYHITVDSNNNALEDVIYFSGRVKVYKSDSEYYDLLGTFKDVGIDELPRHLTNIMKYRKIDITEEIGIELEQHFKGIDNMPSREGGLSYMLTPRFIQYFPQSDTDHIEEVSD